MVILLVLKVALKSCLASARLNENNGAGQSDFADVVSTNYSQYYM